MTPGAALAALLLTTGTASADPVNYCRVTNPPNGESANPCTTFVDESWVYSAGGVGDDGAADGGRAAVTEIWATMRKRTGRS